MFKGSVTSWKQQQQKYFVLFPVIPYDIINMSTDKKIVKNGSFDEIIIGSAIYENTHEIKATFSLAFKTLLAHYE